MRIIELWEWAGAIEFSEQSTHAIKSNSRIHSHSNTRNLPLLRENKLRLQCKSEQYQYPIPSKGYLATKYQIIHYIQVSCIPHEIKISC